MNQGNGLEIKLLEVAARTRWMGATRKDFFSSLKGIGYPQLEKGIVHLANEGLLELDWLSREDFVARITPEGQKRLELT